MGEPKKSKITDEYVLNADFLTAKEASDYLGINWYELTYGLQSGDEPFSKIGFAKQNGSKWNYTIYAKRCYEFKHGKKENHFSEEQLKGICSELIKEIVPAVVGATVKMLYEMKTIQVGE